MQKEFVKILKKKHLGECHDLYLKSDILLLTNVSENVRKICLEIYELDAANFFSSQINLTSSFKKD